MTGELWSKQDLIKGWKKAKDGVLIYQGLLYLPKILQTEVISRNYEDPLAGQVDIEMTWEIIAQKYDLLTLRTDVEFYVKGYNICLASKFVKYKLYDNFQSLSVLTDR